MVNIANIIVLIGLFGLIVITSLNLYAYKVLGKEESAPLSSTWWSQWFVIYLVMGSFCIVGAGLLIF